MLRVQSQVKVALAALALGFMANLLFYDKLPGISVLIFTLLVLVALFGLGWWEKVGLVWRNLWIIAPMLFFALMVFVRANALLTFLNIMAVLGLFSLLVFFFAADRIARLGMLDYPVVLLLTGGQMLSRPAPVISAGAKAAMVHKTRLRVVIKLLRGLLLAIPVLLVFTYLLSSADTIFAKYVNSVGQLKFLKDFPDLFGQLCIILGVAWVAAGSLLFGLSRRQGSEAGNARTALPGVLPLNRRIGFTEGATVLFLVDLLFTAFAYIQFTYLFAGQVASKMDYTAYRDYVRRGFGELLVAASLTLALILGMRWATRLETKGQLRGFNLLSTIMIGLAMVILVSAFQRMLVWENVEYYIYSDIRLYVRAFIIWLGLTFLWLFVTLWLRPDRFAIGFLVAAIGFLVTVNLMNPDAEVARYNLSRQDELSTRYLYLLSDDAVPTLIAGLEQSTPQIQKEIRFDLQRRLIQMESTRRWKEWPSFHLSRAEAYDALVRLRKTGGLPQPGG